MKNITAKVISLKMNKTAVVEVERQRFHPFYKKIIRRTSRLKVHHENGDLKVGDTVKIVQTRPISKEKHFKIATVDKA